ncbi:MAG: hypothetical protein ACLQCB_10065 [Spirochaetia bacterium]
MGQTVCVRCGQILDGRSGFHLVMLCEPCLNALLSSNMEILEELLDSLEQPAALVARDHTVLLSNHRLSRMLEKFDHDIVGLRFGEALGCRYAANEHRCGENEVCLHCGLRRLVELARISGEKIGGFPMTIRHRSGDSQSFTFATEKAGEAVLLMIEMQSQPA